LRSFGDKRALQRPQITQIDAQMPSTTNPMVDVTTQSDGLRLTMERGLLAIAQAESFIQILDLA